MTIRTAVLAGIVLAVVVAACGGGGERSLDPQFAQELQGALDAGLEEHGGKGASFAVIMPDGAKWLGVGGVSHGTTPATPDMLFAAGSITKTWTAATILQLAGEGVLTLEDQVSDWLPAYTNVDSAITIRQLLNHSSGLFDYVKHPDYWQAIWDDPSRTWTPEQTILTFLQEPYFPTGSGWHYSTAGYALLRMIISEATGATVSTEYRSRFWEPLGLEGTFLLPEETLPANVAHGWTDLDGDGNDDDIAAISRTAFSSGSGGQVMSTAEDLAEWSRALYHERRVLDGQSFDDMVEFLPVEAPEEPLVAGYGLGSTRFSPELFDGLEVWGHGGSSPGFAAASLYLPDYGVSIGIVDNTEAGYAMATLNDLISTILRNSR